jgi:alkanesulfonate monooxygenase SsuD/methylene tetrahydromethanopterin reductase-like flavin-dependent oxidoreductase (luciferase family)
MVGAGVPYRLQQSYGISADHPARRAREYLTVVRKSLNNEGDAFDGDFFQVPQCGIGFEVGPASLPVYLAARLPQMLQTAGELADGVFAITITPEYASDQMPHWVECGARRASRSLEDVRMGVFVPGCLAEDPELAYQATRRFLGVRLMNPSTARLYALMGFTDEVQRFGEKAAARDMPGAFAQISERMIAGLTFSGRPADARGRLRAYENAGMQRVVAQIFEAPGSLNVEQSMDWLLTE